MKNRKRNRMKGFDYASNNLYFVTNCVKNNLCCLGIVISDSSVGTGRDLSVHPENHHPEIHHPGNPVMQLNSRGMIVKNQIEWLENQYPYVIIHNYVIMPNHFHLILEIDRLKVNTNEIKIKSLSSLIGALKTTSSSKIRALGFTDFSWHRSFHDHIIRNERECKAISNYIDLNPKKWFEDRFCK
jgi:REP element-mobilizing transposase RayT